MIKSMPGRLLLFTISPVYSTIVTDTEQDKIEKAACLLIGAHSGMRVGSVCNVRVSDISLVREHENGVYHVRVKLL